MWAEGVASRVVECVAVFDLDLEHDCEFEFDLVREREVPVNEREWEIDSVAENDEIEAVFVRTPPIAGIGKFCVRRRSTTMTHAHQLLRKVQKIISIALPPRCAAMMNWCFCRFLLIDSCERAMSLVV